MQLTRNKVTWMWIGWATVSIGGGVALDTWMLRNGRFNDTLTHHSRKITGVHPATSPLRRKVGQVAVIGTCIWVANHIALGPHSDGKLHRIVVDAFRKEEETFDA